MEILLRQIIQSFRTSPLRCNSEQAVGQVWIECGKVQPQPPEIIESVVASGEGGAAQQLIELMDVLPARGVQYIGFLRRLVQPPAALGQSVRYVARAGTGQQTDLLR